MFLAPLLIAVLIFFGILFFLDRKTGKGALQVTANPKSRVFLENKLIGTTPFCACDLAQMLSVGDYSIKLLPINGNFGPFEEKITINKSTLTVVDRTFADNGSSDGSIISLISLSNKKDIEVLIVSMPDKATVFLDSNPVGITPLLLKQVSESDHDLRLTRDGYKNKSIRIKTALGFQLNSLVFLGVNVDLSGPPVASVSVMSSPVIAVSKVLILDTPDTKALGFVRVRQGNSVLTPKVGEVIPGEEYELVSEKDGWFEIKFNSPAGKDKLGWISSQYATKE